LNIDNEVRSTGSTKSQEPREDYYEILNVPYGASKGLVRESYIRLKSAFSGNNNAFYSLISETEAQAMLTRIEEAFRILNDDIRRREYDRSIGFETEEAQSSDLSFPPSAARLDNGYGHAPTRHSLPVDSVTDIVHEQSGAAVPSTGPRTGASGQRPGPAIRRHSDEITQQIQDLIASGDCGDGTLYRRLRELANVSEDEMQARTKVCISYIRAIESNDYQNLPQPVFVKGFLRSYLRYLSVPDVDRMVKAFADKHDEWLRRTER
jgi:hypothetical protein